MKRKTKFKELSRCEKVIMKAVWDSKEDIAVQELIRQLRLRYGKDYARTTVVTFLKKLSEKGYVRTYRTGNASYAHAEITEESYREELIKTEADFWFDGKPSMIMSALFKPEKISKEEIQKMREIMDALDD